MRNGYDSVAEEYRDRLGNELLRKPFDRVWLGAFVSRLPGRARIVEVGCGDGHVADYVSRLLTPSLSRIEGLDLSPGMIAVARTSYPNLQFTVGNLLDLPYDDSSLEAIVSFYSIVNLTAEDCGAAFHEFGRTLAPGGLATVAFHIGDERRRVADWWRTDATLDFYFHPVGRVLAQLESAGLTVLETKQRRPYPEPVETQTQRAYILISKPT